MVQFMPTIKACDNAALYQYACSIFIDGEIMKLLTKSLAPVILLAVLAAGCGEKEETPAVPVPAPVAAAVVPATPQVAPAGAGGYVPTDEERVPGIVLPADAVAAPAVETPAATDTK